MSLLFTIFVYITFNEDTLKPQGWHHSLSRGHTFPYFLLPADFSVFLGGLSGFRWGGGCSQGDFRVFLGGFPLFWGVFMFVYISLVLSFDYIAVICYICIHYV